MKMKTYRVEGRSGERIWKIGEDLLLSFWVFSSEGKNDDVEEKGGMRDERVKSLSLLWWLWLCDVVGYGMAHNRLSEWIRRRWGEFIMNVKWKSHEFIDHISRSPSSVCVCVRRRTSFNLFAKDSSTPAPFNCTPLARSLSLITMIRTTYKMKNWENFIVKLISESRRMWHGITAADFSRISRSSNENQKASESLAKLAQLVSTFPSRRKTLLVLLPPYFKQILEVRKRRKIKSDSALFSLFLLSFRMFCQFFWQAGTSWSERDTTNVTKEGKPPS